MSKVTGAKAFDERMQTVGDDANVVIVECTQGADVGFGDAIKAVQDFVLEQSLSLEEIMGTDQNPIFDLLVSPEKETKEEFSPIEFITLAANPENEAVYFAMPKDADPERFVTGMQEKYGNVFTYIVTDGLSAKTKHIEELDGGIAVDDVTGYEIG